MILENKICVRRPNKEISVFENQYGLLNLFMLGFCVAFLIFYIVQVNYLVSQQYKTEVLKKRIGLIMEEQFKIQSEKMQYDGIPQIVQYSKRSGMIEAGNSSYIFEEGSVARR